jgi:cytochrome c oxidase assembly protein subunit 15
MKNPSILIYRWLFVCAAMVLMMAVIGAITRLTESGLSMVEWKPLIGAIPPLSESKWHRVFDLYKQTPEFIQKNAWMGLADFKTIFFWEWFHRLWGRLIGLVYALPLIWFWVRGMIPPGFKGKLLFALFLGGLQGVMGWIMVKSGLIDRPSVSHYRLAAHLILALAIFGYLLWLAFSLRDSRALKINLSALGLTSLFMVTLTIIWGAFTAGLDGGMLYNTWPLMGGHWVPPDVTAVTALHSDPAGVQFMHRWLAVLAAVVTLVYAWKTNRGALAAAVFCQVALGMATLLSQVYIPVAAAHQAGAFIVFALLLHALRSSSPGAESPDKTTCNR